VSAAISASATEVMEDDSFSIDAQISGATNYTWDMGDGSLFSNQQSVTYSYTTPGIYEITLSASNDDCSAEARQQILVNEKADTVSTSISEAETGGISMFAHDNVLYISQTASKKDMEVSVIIYNTLGQTVVEKKSTLHYSTILEMPLKAPAGIYHATVQSEEGHHKTGKVILTGTSH